MTKPTRRRASNRLPARKTNKRIRVNSTAETVILTSPVVTQARWRARRPKLVALALILSLVVVLLAGFNTDLFYVFDLNINGLSYMNRAEIEQVSGMVGYNIFFIESQSIERTIARLPEIKSVHVTASVPNYLTIDIEERQPEIVWLRGAENFWVDADGIAVRARTSRPDLPSIRDLDQLPLKPGDKPLPEGVAAFRAFRQAWPEGPRALEWSTAHGLAYTDEHGWRIYLGDSHEMAGKLAKFRALVAQLLAQNVKIKFIDLGKGDPYYQ